MSSSPSPRSKSQSQASGSARRKQTTPRKKRKSHVLQDIRQFRKSTDFLIPKLPFARLLKEVVLDIAGPEIRFSYLSIQAIQEAAEAYLVYFLQDAYACARHRDRVTLTVTDMRLVRFLRGPSDLGNL